MPKTEITKLAEKKLVEIALETGNFVEMAKVIDEMERILKGRKGLTTDLWSDEAGRINWSKEELEKWFGEGAEK